VFGAFMFFQSNFPWLTADSLPLMMVFIALICFIVLFMVGFVFQKVSQSNKNQTVQNQLLQQLLEKTAVAYEVGVNNQKQLQDQLNNNHQYLSAQQNELKTYFEQQISDFKLKLLRQHGEQGEKQSLLLQSNNERLSHTLNEHHALFNQNQLKSIDQLVSHLTHVTKVSREELAKSLQLSSEHMAKRIDELTISTDQRLKEISGQVEKRLTDGFEKTTKTFNDILQRLALIDDAQKKITELSSNVVSLQEVLSDKRSRGAFGEVQLNALIRNVLPEQHFSLQHTLSNGKIADCILFLPVPTGNVVIDSKFPFESYKRMSDNQLGEFER
jgi:DNA recombination protein RmuC